MRACVVGRVGLSVLGVILAWLLLSGSALAQGPEETVLDLRLPSEAAVGQELSLEAHLTTSSGAAIAEAPVVFRRLVEYMNATNDLEIGRAVTDEQGVATISFISRSQGDLLITAQFEGDAQYAPSSVSKEFPVQDGPAQYLEEAGVDVPGINVSLLVGILGGVWTTYFVVMSLVLLIAREGAGPPRYVGGVRE